jgi:hypothetical protein
MWSYEHLARRFIARDVFWQFQVDWAGPLFSGNPKGFPNQRWNTACAYDLPGKFRERFHGGDHVDNLESRLTAALNWLLPRDQDHGHCTQMRVRRSGGEIQRPGSESAQTNARPPSEPAVRGGHKRRRLLVPRYDKVNARGAQRLEHVKIFLTRNAKDALHALVLKSRDKKIGTFGHCIVRCSVTR